MITGSSRPDVGSAGVIVSPPAPVPRPSMPLPKICLDLRPALLGRSGVPRATRELARELGRDDRVELHGFGHCFAWARNAPPAMPAMHRLPIPGRSLPTLARIGLDMARLGGGADLAHWTDYVFPPVNEGTPVVCTIHDIAFLTDDAFHGPNTDELSRRARFAVERAVRVICPTDFVRGEVIERLGASESEVVSIAWGLDHGGVFPTTSPAGGAHLLALGTIEPRKNHARLLDAWEQLGAERPPLVVVGRLGWESTEVAERLTTTNGVTWLQRVAEPELQGLFDSALAVLYPSLHEGFGFPALEGLVRGLPTLVGETPALREVAGRHATFVDPLSVDSIHDGLERVLADSGATTEERVRDARRFRWSRCASAHVEQYLEVIG